MKRSRQSRRPLRKRSTFRPRPPGRARYASLWSGTGDKIAQDPVLAAMLADNAAGSAAPKFSLADLLLALTGIGRPLLTMRRKTPQPIDDPETPRGSQRKPRS